MTIRQMTIGQNKCLKLYQTDLSEMKLVDAFGGINLAFVEAQVSAANLRLKKED